MSAITEQKPLVPELRFSGFDGEWKQEKLGNIANVTSSKRVYSADYVTSGTPFFRGKEITELKNGELPSNLLYIKKSRYDEFKNTFGAPANGDILITSVGTLGNVYKVDLEYDFYFKDGNLIWLKELKIDSSFLTFNLTRNKENLLKNHIGSTQKALTIDGIKKTELVVAETLPEQHKIADFLGSVDAWLDNLRGQKTALQSYKQGMMQKLFSGQIRFKDEEGRNYPEWQEVSMSDIGDSFGGLSGKSGDDFGQGESFITYKQIFDDSIIEPEKFAQVTVAPGEKQNRAQKGDVFFTVSSETPNEVGYASVLMEDVNPYLNSFAFGFRPKSITDLLPEYSRYHFRSAPFRRQVVRLAQGSTRYNISKVQFMKLVIEIPPPGEQQKIADFLTALDQTITTKADEITKVEEWKKGLMQKMFV